MVRWSRSLPKVLLALALLWQSVIAPMAAAAGCCDGEQACCVALRAGAACATCIPVLADTATAEVKSPAAADGPLTAWVPQAWLSSFLHDIWRPPMPAA